MKLINRASYIDKLMSNLRTNQIKILTGVRHAGKTSILSMFQDRLVSSSIATDDIIYIDFEGAGLSFITESATLYDFLTSRISQNELKYLIFDEIQGIKDWQKVILALKMDFNVDIYISLSRASGLSKLGKDVVKIEVLPLSFKEYQMFSASDEEQDKNKVLSDYLTMGAMPTKSNTNDIFYSIIAQDVLIANKIADNAMMMWLIRILMSEMGKTHSYNSLCKILSEVVEKAPAVRTVESYVRMLIEAHLFYSVPVFDLKDSHKLSRYAKYYPVDLAFYSLIMGKPDPHDTHILESVIYFELLRLDVTVSTCKIGQKKVAFLAESEDNKLYIHVTDTLGNDSKAKAIMAPLRSINDHYSKWILTLDESYGHSNDGLRVSNINEFLLED